MFSLEFKLWPRKILGAAMVAAPATALVFIKDRRFMGLGVIGVY